MLIRLKEKIKENINKKDINSISFSDLIDKWLEIDSKTAVGQTVIAHQIYAKIFKEEFGSILTNKLNASVFNNYLLSLTNKDLAYVTVQGYKNTLSLILKFGNKLGYIENKLHE